MSKHWRSSTPTLAPIYDRALGHLDAAESIEDFRHALAETYALNLVTVSDTGSGMSSEELESIFLVIGTPSRKKEIQEAFDNDERDAPYLGEKGIGRLSAMRLGERLSVRTARAEDSHWNHLDIDWTAFDDLDAMLRGHRYPAVPGQRKSPTSTLIGKDTGLDTTRPRHRRSVLVRSLLVQQTTVPGHRWHRRSRVRPSAPRPVDRDSTL